MKRFIFTLLIAFCIISVAFPAHAVTGSVSLANIRLSLVNGTAFVDFSAANTLTPYLNWRLRLCDSANKCAIGYIKSAGGTGVNYTGTVNAPNVKLSLVDGTAFADAGATVNLAQYADGKHLVTFTDSAGKVATGYLKAAGTGETLSETEKFADTGFDNDASWLKFSTGWTVSGSKGVATTAVGAAAIYQSIASTVGALYKMQVDMTITSGGLRSQFGGNLGTTVTTSLTQTDYITSKTATANSGIVAVGTTTGTIDNITAKQVLTPSTSGSTIVSTYNGSTQSFASVQTGFNPNDTSYTVTVSGETYGNELVTNGTFDSDTTGWSAFTGSPTLASVEGGQSGNALSITNNGATWTTGTAKYSITLTSGNVYRVLYFSKLGTATVSQVRLISNGENIESYIYHSGNITDVNWTQHSGYTTAPVSLSSPQILNICVTFPGATALFDTQSVRSVTAPSPTGVTITSTRGGTTYNWASIETGFNYNDASGYTYTITSISGGMFLGLGFGF